MAIKGFSELTLINLENIPFVEGELLTVLSKKRGDFLLQRQPKESYNM